MKDIIKFLVVTGITFLAIAISLIHIYASPDKELHILPAAISYFSASLYLSLYIFTLNKNTHTILKWIIIFLSTWVIVLGAPLAYYEIFPPLGYVADKFAGNIFIFSILTVSISLYILGKNMTKNIGEIDEK